jgi:hypothetical protein
MFEQLSGLKIHFRKSEIFLFGVAKQCEGIYLYLISSKLGSFPFWLSRFIDDIPNTENQITEIEKKRKGLKKYLVFGKENICVAEGRQITVD